MEWTEVEKPQPDCKIPLYGIHWLDAKGRKWSNSWPSQTYAESMEQKLLGKGCTILAKNIRYIGGWAF